MTLKFTKFENMLTIRQNKSTGTIFTMKQANEC